MKRLGPELKMPDLKMPPLVADLYYDLRDRRLLPLIALVVVAIAAVPFLLGESEDAAPPPSANGPMAGESPAAEAAAIAVVEAKPGLRDYRERLADRTPTNPFRQHYTAPYLAGADLPDSEGASSASATVTTTGSSDTTTSEVTTTTEGGSQGSDGGNGGGGSSGGAGTDSPDQRPRLIEFVFDVQISRLETSADGGQKMSDPEIRHRVRSLAQLPGKKRPVATVGGLNLHNGKVIFLVSNEVRSLDGDFACLARTPTRLCELLEIEPGFPFDLIYGPNEVLYRFKVTKVDAVWAGRVGDERSSNADLEGRYVRGDFGAP
jgi:hypothetical protein